VLKETVLRTGCLNGGYELDTSERGQCW